MAFQINVEHFKEAFHQLNSEQKAAVEQIEGPVLVMAGPGTGKTQIIAVRIAQILKETQLNPYNILCLTFTESGVVAMRERLLGLIGDAAYSIRIHTFHSFCNSVIQEFPEKFAFTRALEPLTELDRILLFRELIEKLAPDNPLKPFGFPYLYLREIVRSIQDLKREDVSEILFGTILNTIEDFLRNNSEALENFLSTHARQLKDEDLEAMKTLLKEGPLAYMLPQLEKLSKTEFKANLKKTYQDLKTNLPKQRALEGLYGSYQKSLHHHGYYDYEDMILFVVRAFKEDKALLAHYQEQFQYFLVDEFQDTNHAQNELVTLLASFFENPNLFVVGDDKQSIYRFQGASLENLLNFGDRYAPHLKLIELRENYRSQQGVLDAAHTLIPGGEAPLRSQDPAPGQPLNLVELATPQEELIFIAKRIQELLTQGTAPSEIAILFRNRWHAEGLSDLLSRLKIPNHLEAGENLLNDRHIRQILQLIRYLLQPSDQDLFFILHYDFLGFDPMAIHQLTSEAAQKKVSLFNLILTTPPFDVFAKQCLEWRKQLPNLKLIEWLERIFQQSGFFRFLLNSPEPVQDLNRLYSLFEEVKQWNRVQPNLTIQQVLERLALMQEHQLEINEQPIPTEREAVKLMTAHKSKGLEFDEVFILRCVDGAWGNPVARGKLKWPPGLLFHEEALSRNVNEEERRLFYVALTRARKNVTLSYSRTNERNQPQSPSQFLHELGEAHLKKWDPTPYFQDSVDRLATFFQPVEPEFLQDMEKDFIRALIARHCFSVTHLNNYLECPRRFYFENLLRVPRLKPLPAAYGTAVHCALRDFFVEFKMSPTLPALEFLTSHFEDHLNRELLSPHDFHIALHQGKKVLTDYYETQRESFSRHVLPEYSFSGHHIEWEGIRLTGQIDKIEFLDDSKKKIKVVDYKTGKPDDKAVHLVPGGDYHRQIVFYKFLCDLSPRFPYEMEYGEIEFLERSRRTGNYEKKKIYIAEADTEDLKETLRRVYREITSLHFLENLDLHCGECEFCQFMKKS